VPVTELATFSAAPEARLAGHPWLILAQWNE